MSTWGRGSKGTEREQEGKNKALAPYTVPQENNKFIAVCLSSRMFAPQSGGAGQTEGQREELTEDVNRTRASLPSVCTGPVSPGSALSSHRSRSWAWSCTTAAAWLETSPRFLKPIGSWARQAAPSLQPGHGPLTPGTIKKHRWRSASMAPQLWPTWR